MAYGTRYSKLQRRADARRRLYNDKCAIVRARRIIDFDIKAKLKEGASAVAGGLDWVSSKMKERIDPEKFASEQEARAAEKQKLKELSTIKGLLKECGSLIKGKVVGFGGKIKEDALEKLSAIAGKIMGFVRGSSIWKYVGSAAALVAFIKIILMVVKSLFSAKALTADPSPKAIEGKGGQFENIGPWAR